ncbi:hypothetical protein A2U01_0034963, partial [Trifolium medium]|nr:hypothetical protein [Trifolium medium]
QSLDDDQLFFWDAMIFIFNELWRRMSNVKMTSDVNFSQSATAMAAAGDGGAWILL